MNRLCLVMLAILLSAAPALAGPNAGGVLMIHDAGLLMSATNGSVSICDQGIVPEQCDAIDSEIDGAGDLGGDQAVCKVYAAFWYPPRLMGLTWGVTYNPDNIILASFGKCGDFELNDDGWPASGTGSTVTWNVVQTGLLVPVYWFAAYTYGAPDELLLTQHPTQGGFFGDDSVPAILDPIAAFGILGFDMPGVLSCAPQIGVCCNPENGECFVGHELDCPDWIWHPEWVSCDPNPCPPPTGACCAPDGSCTVTPQAECPAGYFWMAGFNCDPNPCPCCAPGACCFPDGHCELVMEGTCLAAQGQWFGEGVPCSDVVCVPTPIERSSWGTIKARYR